MNTYQQLIGKEAKMSVIGLGYVGMPIAVAFSKKVDVIGFDINVDKVNSYKMGKDPTCEVGDDEIKASTIEFTSCAEKLKEAIFHIVAVPTPINMDKTPDLDPVIGASRILGGNLAKGSVVVYESTVYPGVTENTCIPILEKESGLKCGIDFKIGYSPERINPGDKVHRLDNIKKIVSGMDESTLNTIAQVYELVIKAGVHRAPSIKVAEAAKVVENSQRDINIAFMNELAMAFDKMGIDTKDVLDAMNTKWNALGFTPGLVGGHCIGVDPYYFIYEAEKLGYHSQIIMAGRKINDGMRRYIADTIIRKLILAGKNVKDARIAILGITFKENCPDSRNTKTYDIIKRLLEYGITPIVVDPLADYAEVNKEYNVELYEYEQVSDLDCVVLAVPHKEFIQKRFEDIEKLFRPIPNNERIVIDVKSVLDKDVITQKGYIYWRL